MVSAAFVVVTAAVVVVLPVVVVAAAALYDKYKTGSLESVHQKHGDGQQVIYKHAISTVVPLRPVALRESEEEAAL